MAVTASMTTARCLICMTAGAAFTAVVFAIFLDGLADIHNAQAGFSGTFHLSHSRHDRHFLLSDPNRWRILSALAIQEMSVGDLAAVVAMSESAVSHQLRILRNSRLVKYRKQGAMCFIPSRTTIFLICIEMYLNISMSLRPSGSEFAWGPSRAQWACHIAIPL